MVLSGAKRNWNRRIFMKKQTEIDGKVLWITRTAVSLALLTALQLVTRPMGQLVTGSCVNCILTLSVLFCGLSGGLVVAMASPFLAFVLNIGPAVFAVTPAIALGNAVLVAIVYLIAGRRSIFLSGGGPCPLGNGGRAPASRSGAGKGRSFLMSCIAAWLACSVGKFLALYLIVVQLLCRVLSLPEKQVQMLGVMFSYPQLLTALIGSGIAFVIAGRLGKAVS